MKRMLPITLLVALSAACSSTRGGHYGNAQEFDADCRVKDTQISIEVETNGKPLREVELVLQDGTVVQPEAVRGPRGKEVALGFASDEPDAALTIDTHKQPSRLFLQFPNEGTGSGPRQLVLTPETGSTSSILLASVKGEKVDSRFSLFGYTREIRTFPDGTKETLYVRNDPDGQRHETSREDFEQFIAPSITQIFETMPATAGEIADAPGVTQFLSSLFEQGVRYEGDSVGADAASLAHTNSFRTSPVHVVYYDKKGREQKQEDPLSSITRLLVSAVNAAHAAELEDLYERVRNGECEEGQFVRAEAACKARNLREALLVLRDSTNSLSVPHWQKQKYGHYFDLYMGWLNEAEAGAEDEDGTLARLTGTILDSLTRKGLNRGEKPISYHMKLQRIFRELSAEVAE